jgi:hypothetical protein
MAEKNSFYRNFSNRCSFNGQTCGTDEELVPAVLTKDLIITLKPMGLNYNNVETWTFPHGKRVPVVFISNKKGKLEEYMKFFNGEVERYIKHSDEIVSDDLSLDEFLEKIDDEDGQGFDPSGTTENEDIAFLMMTIKDLIHEVSQKYPEVDKILNLIIDGYQKNEIFEQVDLGRGKTQAYSYIDKIQKYAKDLYDEKYR